jgi:branched-chain amino acid transport system permease protein
LGNAGYPVDSCMIDPIFLAEAAINGILLGGVLALLALGLNLIFGVIDIVWIAYVDLVMLCMYAIYFLVTVYGWPIWLAGIAAIGAGGLLGIGVHLLIISPILTSPPINQLLATGGLLFFIQSFATFLWTTDHRSIRLTLPIIEVGGMFLSFARLIAFVIAIGAMLGLYLFLTRTYMGTAIRAVSQDREAMVLMGADPHAVYLVTSAVGGAMAGLAGVLLMLQYSVHPHFGSAFGPLTFMICVLGGLGNMVGAFVASFIMSEVISIGGVLLSTEMGYVVAFALFIVMMFARPGGILARRE